MIALIPGIAFALAAILFLRGKINGGGGGGSLFGGGSWEAILSPFLKKFEGFSPEPYWDYEQYSIGYGSRYVEGVTSNPIGEGEAEALMIAKVRNTYYPEARANLLARSGIDLDDLPEHQKAAIVSFAYNLGAGAIRNASWPIRIKEGDLTRAKTSWIQHWNAGGGKLEGLVRRRCAEWQLFSTGRWDFDPPGWREWL